MLGEFPFRTEGISIGSEESQESAAKRRGRVGGVLIVGPGEANSGVAAFANRLIAANTAVSIVKDMAAEADSMRFLDALLQDGRFWGVVFLPATTNGINFAKSRTWTSIVEANSRALLSVRDSQDCISLMRLCQESQDMWEEPILMHGLHIEIDPSVQGSESDSFIQKLDEAGAFVSRTPSVKSDFLITESLLTKEMPTAWVPIAGPQDPPRCLRVVPLRVPHPALLGVILGLEVVAATPEAKWRRWLW